MNKKYILLFAGFLLALNIFCWKEVFALAGDNYLRVDFLDVGQGDSAFIETPQLHQILIDGGPSSAVLKKIAKQMPFWDKTIDLVVLSHPESDHMQGLLDVLQRYKADYILWTGVVKDTPEYRQWINVLQKQKQKGAKILIAEQGQKIKAGDLEIDTLFPFESLEGQQLTASANDTCVVNRLIYGEDSFLFTGDISSALEEQLANSHELAELKSDVLKVAHHGSKYSSSDLFLQAVNPKLAVISVGAKNTYGHPTPETLQRLSGVGAKVLRTDQNGDITIISDGNNLKLLNN